MRLILLLFALVASPALAQNVVIKQPKTVDDRGAAKQLWQTFIYNPDGTLHDFSAPRRATSTTANGSVTTANTFQSALAASATRKGCTIYNTSAAVILMFLGAPGSATSAKSIPIPAGGGLSCTAAGGLVITDQISLTSATAGATFVVISQ
jgi:hypothetical protein